MNKKNEVKSTCVLINFWNWIKGLFSDEVEVAVETGIKVSPVSTAKVYPDVDYKTEPTIVVEHEVVEPQGFKSGKFFEADIKIIIEATKDKDPKSVNWEELSITLNRSEKSLKAKAKKLQK